MTRIRHAVFGRPLTHDEAKARTEAEIARARATGGAANDSRARSVQGQTFGGL
ncbi:hypothetical protein [Microbacterium sp. SLBN-146]|uniref:hypothetical protein n=1 Tax=Microbacterium sp. SLBN-146 TaxID=2768457 RepID=UPI001C930720|nr:hypothetical protein [Microbacterium sp. SLBN-146]